MPLFSFVLLQQKKMAFSYQRPTSLLALWIPPSFAFSRPYWVNYLPMFLCFIIFIIINIMFLWSKLYTRDTFFVSDFISRAVLNLVFLPLSPLKLLSQNHKHTPCHKPTGHISVPFYSVFEIICQVDQSLLETWFILDFFKTILSWLSHWLCNLSPFAASFSSKYWGSSGFSSRIFFLYILSWSGFVNYNGYI